MALFEALNFSYLVRKVLGDKMGRYRRDYSYSYGYSDPLRDLVEPVVSSPTVRSWSNALQTIRRETIIALEDNRVFNPDPLRRPMASISAASDVVTKPRFEETSTAQPLSRGLSFRDPSRVSLCARRHVRREVLLAKGKGGGGHRRPRRNQFSDIGC